MENPNLAQQVVATPATANDSVRAKAKATALAALRKREKAEQQTLSQTDSAFFFSRDTTFEQICGHTTDINTLVNSTSWLKNQERISKTAPLARTTEKPSAKELPLRERGTTDLRPYADIVVGLSLLIVIILGIISSTTTSFVTDVLGFFNGSNGWRRLKKANESHTNFAFAMLDGVYIIILTVLAMEMAIVMHTFSISSKMSVIIIAGEIAAGICLFYAVRAFIDRVIGYAFMTEGLMRDISLSRHASRSTMGIILTPFVLTMPFVSTTACDIMGKTAIGLVLLVTSWRIAKTAKINSTSLQSILYFILYLCIVEIAPALCIARIAMLAYGTAE